MPFILIALGGWLLSLSWNKWTNITLDYGRELYTPWLITRGQVLYKDILTIHGPFPSYFNALLFKVFGTSLMTLVLFNILLVAVITTLIYRFFIYTTDKRAAFFASAVFLSIFAFSESSRGQGNFAYICPYTYTVTYATFFSIWAIELFASRQPKNVPWTAVGILVGLTALCRFEIFIFLVIALLAGFIIQGSLEHWPLKVFLRKGLLVLSGFSLPVGIACLYFATQLPLSQVWPSILSCKHHWVEISQIYFYRYMLGLDHPWQNFRIMLAAAACYGFVLLTFKSLCMGMDGIEKNNRPWTGAFFILMGLGGIAEIVIWAVYFHDKHMFKGLPILMAFLLFFLAWRLWRHRQGLPLFVMTLWGSLMLSRVILNVQVDFEGFVYAMPAALMFVAFFQGLVPGYFERVHRRGNFISAAASVLLVLMMVLGLLSLHHIYQARDLQVRAGPNLVIGDSSSNPQVGDIAAFLKDVDKIMGKDANFVVFPEGVMLNFLTQRPDPIPYTSFINVERVDFSSQAMLRSLEEHRPDYVIFSYPISIYFYPQHEKQYPLAVRSWVLDNYYPVWPVHPAMKDTIMVLKRYR